jgi:hypothetical protein
MPSFMKTATVAALALLIHSAPASAQFLSFVSATGNDANTCFVQANPCLTLQRGINATSAGGEVRVLSQLTSNGFINKSITIEGGGNTIIGTIAVNSASAVVTFRGLTLNGRHAFATGFNIINAAAVHIENCTAERFTQYGIRSASGVSTEIFVSDSVSRDNGASGLLGAFSSPNAKLTVDNSRFENNGVFGAVVEGGQASVTGSVFSGNLIVGMHQTGGSTNITYSTAVANGSAGFEVDIGEMTLDSCVARGNNFGLFAAQSTVARISNSVFTNNTTGIQNDGTALTLGDNVIAGNGTGVGGTALTPLGGL